MSTGTLISTDNDTAYRNRLKEFSMAISEILFAGHSAVFLRNSSTTIAIDPWLSANPSCPDELKEPENLDLIILTHGHSDHAADAVRLAKNFGCFVCATFELATLLVQEGVAEKNVLFMNKGGTLEWEGFSITLTNAFHSSSYETSSGQIAYAGEPCGVIVHDGIRAFYHAGDTCLFEDMKLIGRNYRPEVAFLPIGDRFTMNPIEAAQAARLINCATVIPIHWGTFPQLTGTPEEFVEALEDADAKPVIMNPGDIYRV